MGISDNIILYGGLLLTSALIYAVRKHNKPFFFINIGIFIIYTCYFLYGLFFDSEYGGAIVWWFYLIAITYLHSIILIIFWLIKKFKSHPSKDE